MTKKITLSPDLSLPLDAITQTFAALAVRGAGKTYLAGKFVEEMARHHLPYCVIDPTGAWYGIRAAANGKGPGLPVIIMGGDHGDVPLSPESGEVVADFVVEERQPVVLDLSLMRKGEAVRFMTAFSETLYRKNRKPLMLVIDEADAFAPQKPMPDQARLLGAIEDIVRRGRIRGLGVFMLTQRAAVLNKNVLTQIETLIVLRTTSPQDRKAIESWIDANEDGRHQASEVLGSLASLPNGTAWFWSPQWLDILKKVKIGTRWTFNSSATPKLGEARIEPRRMAAVDLAALQARIGATIERAKANDPAALRREIAELKGQVKELTVNPIVKVLPAIKAEKVMVPILKDGRIRRLEFLIKDAREASETLVAAAADLGKRVAEVKALCAPPLYSIKATPAQVAAVRKSVGHMRPAAIQAEPVRVTLTNPEADCLNAARGRILDALAFFEACQQTSVEKARVAFFSGASPTSGGFYSNLSTLMTAGLIVYPTPGFAALTAAGRRLADAGTVPQTSADVQKAVLEKMATAKRRIVEAALAAYPDGASKILVAQQVGASATSGGFYSNLSDLNAAGLITYPKPGYVRASDSLFLPDCVMPVGDMMGV